MKSGRVCLLLHGFTGGPYEVRPLAEHLESRGWTCKVPTLPGHDGPLRDLYHTRYEEWVLAAAAIAGELTERHGSFDLVGFSMGGLIAAYLANRFPVRRMALLNAAVHYVSPGRFVRNAVRVLRSGEIRELRSKRETPVGAVIEFAKLVRRLKPEIAKIRTPTFIAQGELDEVVHPRSAVYIASRVKGEKTMTVYPHSRHMLCFEPDATYVFRHVERFFSEGDR
ncbi:alpha/beta fold hydrolase [Paenibacillus antri]|uniref:Alpha/beta fold hydrolase n=1 Tax=Paenibacillus antri TaxID=2582848 RepID=A0A5R9G9M2_9BACL|nr:alpha/beta fold hydrolase [Paenibacillus antri]TLS53137.1 alpha/beta fold hydrolase [Paenibacillus antri]